VTSTEETAAPTMKKRAVLWLIVVCMVINQGAGEYIYL
jgi:hypothetical protein